MPRLRTLVLILLVTGGWPLAAQVTPPALNPPAGKPIDQGLWWLYHLQYDRARHVFDQYIDANPKDPAGYFYKAAIDWWQLAQEFDRSLPEVVAMLEKDFQATVQVANALIESTDDPKIKGRAYLYMGGAQGLKGRWLVTQGQWVKAYFMGKNGHRSLKRALQYDPTLYDAYLGLGIYDYFTDTLGGAQRVLAALLIRGDRKRGLQELQWAIEKGEHARVEAMMFLIEIYTWEEDTPEKALPLSQQMHAEFPQSPAMYLAEIMNHYEMKQWDTVAVQAQDFLQKSQLQVPYYQHAGVHPARYCLGVAAFWGRRDPDTCLHYMEQIVAEAEKDSRWVTFALLRTGQVYDLKGDREKAQDYYRKVLARPNFWGSHRETRNYLKNPFKY